LFFAEFFQTCETSFEHHAKLSGHNLTDMKTKNLMTVAAVSAGLSLGVAQAAPEREHQEQTINSSEVPAAVQSAAQTQAQGGTIVRWEKEGANFEAVIEKNGKQIGLEMDASGKVLKKHSEAKEHQEKGAKY
jgi:plastocyanin